MKASLLVLLVIGACLATAGNAATVHDLLSKLDSTGGWKVVFLEAPLAKAKVGDVFGKFNAYHAGVGFQNSETKEEYMVEFNAVGGLNLAKLLPGIEGDNLVWRKDGEVLAHNVIDPHGGQYWERFNHISTISDDTMSKFKSWVLEYQKNAPEYQIFGLRDENGNVLMKSHTCYDFTFTVIDKLAELGAVFTRSEQQRDVFDLEIQVDTLKPADGDDELRWWSMVYRDISKAKLLREKDLSHAIHDIIHALKKYKDDKNSHPSLFYSIQGQAYTFRCTDRGIIAGYMKQKIPSVKVEDMTPVYSVRED